MEEYRLPNGKTTKSVNKMIKAWRDLAKPIEEATGATVRGFDPGISFNFDYHCIQLPIGFVEALNKALKKGDKDA